MLTIASLLAAMTIAGAFWVGVLAARRLRDWGEGRRALEEGEQPLALVAASGALQDDDRVRRIRERVAQRLMHDRSAERLPQPRALAQAGEPDLGLTNLRAGDVLLLEDGRQDVDGDYLVDGLVHLREGSRDTVVVVMRDGDRERWLVGSPDADPWFLLDPVVGHGLAGEPPRQIEHDGRRFALERRGQASAAITGQPHRPEMPRVATYLYRASSQEVLWIERWRDEVVMGQGRTVPVYAVRFLPGS